MAVVDGAKSLQENTYQQNCVQPSTSASVVPAFENINNDGRNGEVQHGDSLYSISDTAGRSKTKDNLNIGNTEHEAKAKLRTNEMPNCLNDLNLRSPKDKDSRSRSRESSCSSRSSSRSGTSRSRSRSSHSRSRSASRSSSRGRHRKRRYRRSSRSSSRSRSRSVSPRYRRCHSSRSHRRYYRSPPRYRSRSRSRSRGRAYYRRYRSRSRSRSRGRRYYGFVRRAYPATFRSWRSRSRTRSRSRSHSPLRLTEKDRRELLEIAKANAAKALGKNVDLPPSLKMDPLFKEAKKKSIEADVAKLAYQSSDVSEVPSEVSPRQGAVAFNPNNAVAKPAVEKQCTRSPPKDEKRNPYGQWIPIQKEPGYSGLSPKNTYMPIR